MAPASRHLWERVQQVAVTLHAPESKRRLSEDGFARVPPPCSCQALLYKTQHLQRSSPWPSHTSALLPACRDPHRPPDMRVLCVVFAVLLLFSMAVPGYGQKKGFCAGYCSYSCAKTDEWTFHQTCGKMYCCIPPPKKGK
uniref:Uncharacterized protein n=1 Tax=Anas platyrhynchos platyrhynchos TaxID=8840 RepID=A0A493T7I0_ANAPP